MSGSDYTTTPNLGLFKPNFAADYGQWGTHLNANSDTLDHALSTGTGGMFLPLSGGTMTGSITLGTGATLTSTGDLNMSPAYNGHIGMGANVNWPGPGPNLYNSVYNVGGTVAAGQQPIIESHVFGDSADASAAQGGGMTWTRFGGNLNAGAIGGRTAFGATLTQNGATTCGVGQFYVASAFWADASYSAGGAAGALKGELFASNDGVQLNTGAGSYWNSLVGYELDMAAQTGVGVAYKQGIKIVLLASDAVAGTAGADFAYGIAAQGPGNSQPGFNYGIAFGSPDGDWAMAATGTLIGTPPQIGGARARTAQYGVDFSGVSFSQDAFRSSGFSVDGYGDVQANSVYVGANAASLSNSGTLTAVSATLSGGATVGAGLHCGSVLASSSTDLSKHLDLYNGQFGLDVTSGNLNVVTAVGSSTSFYSGPSFVGAIMSSGLNYMPIGVTSAAAGNFSQVATGGASGPTWTTGSTAPASTQPVGSLYSRVGGAVGATLYVSRGGGTWAAVAGV